MKPNPAHLIVIATVVILILQASASAHAFLDHAEPRVGSAISQAPSDVRIWFTQAVEPAFSRIEVFDAGGKRVDGKDAHVDPGDHHILIISLPRLAAGTYKVSWRVVSVDTHRTQGDFKFTVKP